MIQGLSGLQRRLSDAAGLAAVRQAAAARRRRSMAIRAVRSRNGLVDAWAPLGTPPRRLAGT